VPITARLVGWLWLLVTAALTFNNSACRIFHSEFKLQWHSLHSVFKLQSTQGRGTIA